MANIVFIVICLATSVLALNPGLRLQINEALLNSMKNIGLGFINGDLSGHHLPDVSGEKDIFHYKLSNVVIASFSIPQDNAQISLDPPSIVGFSAHDMSASLQADYKVSIKKGWFHISKSGTIEISTSEASFSQQLRVTELNGKAHVNAENCHAEVGNLKVEFHGDLIDDIIDLFEKELIDFFKDIMDREICKELESLIDSKVNGYTQNISTSANISKIVPGFYVDMSLTSSPFCESNDIVIPLKAQIWYTGHHDDTNAPTASPMPSIQGSNRMICSQISPAYMIQSVAYAAEQAGLLHLEVQKILDNPQLRKYMACNCTGIKGLCLGVFVPQIATKCPDGIITFELKSVHSPTVVTNTSGLFVTLGAEIGFKGEMSNGDVEDLFTIDVSMSTEVSSSMAIRDWVFSGRAYVTNAVLAVKSSQIGSLDERGLQQLWNLVVLAGVEGGLNGMMLKGFKLPSLPLVKVQDTQLTFGNNEIHACANIVMKI